MAAKTSAQLLLDEINRVNEADFTEDQLRYGQPVVVDEHDCNTLITVYATENSGLVGSQPVWYSRVDLTDMFERAGVHDITLKCAHLSTTLDLLTEINARFELALGPEDIHAEPLNHPARGAVGEATLVAKHTSLAFIGELKVHLVLEVLELKEVIVQTVLDGLYPSYVRS